MSEYVYGDPEKGKHAGACRFGVFGCKMACHCWCHFPKNGWYCEHHDEIATGNRAARWETYCKANRRCEIGPAGCHAVVVPREMEEA